MSDRGREKIKREEREKKVVQSHKKGVQEWRRKHKERKEQWGILLSPIVKGYFLSQGANPASISIFMSPMSGAWQSMSLPHLVTYVRTRTHTDTHSNSHSPSLFNTLPSQLTHSTHSTRSLTAPLVSVCVYASCTPISRSEQYNRAEDCWQHFSYLSKYSSFLL